MFAMLPIKWQKYQQKYMEFHYPSSDNVQISMRTLETGQPLGLKKELLKSPNVPRECKKHLLKNFQDSSQQKQKTKLRQVQVGHKKHDVVWCLY